MKMISFEAIGTHWEIEINTELPEAELAAVEKAVRHRIDEFDLTYSRFRDDSTLMQLAKQAGTYEFPDDAKPLFDFYKALYDATGGKVTPLIGDTLVTAGYDAAYSLKPKGEPVKTEKWPDIIEYSHPFMTVSRPVTLDVGAAGKGYLVDIVGELLDKTNIHNYLIDASGDMLHKSIPSVPVRIGLEHPIDPTQAIGVLDLGEESVCGSSVGKRQWAGLHHIMDPDSGKPVQEIAAVWVVAKTAMMADGLATALFFTPATELQNTFEFEYLIVRPDMSFESSSNLRAEIFQ